MSQSNDLFAVTAIIINYNSFFHTCQCIKTLLNQTYMPQQIVVIDNASTDDSVVKINEQYKHVQVVSMAENNGLPAARNGGLQVATTDLILFVDNDVYLHEDCLYHLLQAYKLHQPILTCPRILFTPNKEMIQADGAFPHFMGTLKLRHGYQLLDDIEQPSQGFVPASPGGCILVHAPTVRGLGGFDEDYFIYFEDLEFSVRFRILGHQLLFVPTAITYHAQQAMANLSFRGEGKYPVRRAYLTMRQRVMGIFVFYRMRTILILLPAFVLYEMATVVMAIKKGWFLAWCRSWWWQWQNAGKIWRKRQKIQRNRVVDDKKLLFDGDLPFTPGFIESKVAIIIVKALSTLLNGYWRITKRWVG